MNSAHANLDARETRQPASSKSNFQWWLPQYPYAMFGHGPIMFGSSRVMFVIEWPPVSAENSGRRTTIAKHSRPRALPATCSNVSANSENGFWTTVMATRACVSIATASMAPALAARLPRRKHHLHVAKVRDDADVLQALLAASPSRDMPIYDRETEYKQSQRNGCYLLDRRRIHCTNPTIVANS